MHSTLIIDGPHAGVITGATRREVRLCDLAGLFQDERAFNAAVAKENVVVYEVYLVEPSHADGAKLGYGTTVLYPTMVGAEYGFTRGHRHQVLDRTEVYQVLQGTGYLLLVDATGAWESVRLNPGTVAYIGGGQAHRVINTGETPLVWFAVYPSDAGHDYRWAEEHGFGHRLLKIDGEPQWRS